ncbi:MAG: autorepressor SdpR family transcription factor [Lachnospiraceae bacterium]|nr:autorepressor SdpR family transcription factor [Lachnospiraceae bacterium]
MGFAETFKALSDPVRRDILDLLRKESLSAGEIGSHFDMTGATISYHLRILKEAGLVKENRVKNYIYYELNTSVLEEIMAWLTDLRDDSISAEDKTEHIKLSDTPDI